ncbi:MAG: hypothetical protein ABIQ95_01675 [Bdellovibrionia bacterium]
MKKTILLILTLLGTSLASADMSLFQLQDMDPLALINWKVGDSSDYNLSLAFGKGSMHKEVTSEEGTGVWLTQNVAIMGQKDVSQILLDRNTGKITKMLHNGKEEAIPNEQPEIISQDYTDVTVPAGTFKCIHIVAKTKTVKRIEMWANPKEVVIDGAIKEVISSQFGDITLELTKQNKAQ